MPGPAVYIAVAVVGVVAVGIAFHELVYEPHIAPKVEVWAESFLEKRRQKKRQRQGSVLASPHPFEGGNENSTRRFGNGKNKKDDDEDDDDDVSGTGMSIELEQLAAKERDAWRREAGPSSLRQRRPAGAMDDSNPSIPYPAMSPTHVLFDTSEPPSPSARSTLSSSRSSPRNSPSHPIIRLSEPPARVAKSPSPPPRGMSPRLPTPMSNYSPISSTATLSEHSDFDSRRPTPDIAASQALTSAYNTPLGGSVISECSRSPEDIRSFPASRIQSPFSDIHSVDARSTPEHLYARSPIASPRVQSPSIGSDLSMDEDDEYDILSPRSGMFSPPSRVGEFHYDGASDASWASVGRRSPGPAF